MRRRRGAEPVELVFGAYDAKAGAVGSLWDVVADRRLNHRPEVVAGVLADESTDLLDGFFRTHRASDAASRAVRRLDFGLERALR